MARKASEAVDALRNAVRQLEKPVVERILLEDGTCSFSVQDQDIGFVRVSCLLLDLDAYPNTAVMLCTEDNNAPGRQEGLEALAERFFSDKAPLAEVVIKVLELFGHSDAAKQLSALMAPPSAAGTPGGGSGGAGGSAPSTAARAQSTGTRSRRSSRRSEGAGGAASMDEDEVSQGADGSDVEYGSGDNDDEGRGTDYMDEDQDADEGEGGGDDMDEEEVSDEEERELTIECGKRQGRWEKYEEKLREQESDEQAAPSAGLHQASVKKLQIFDDREAFLMLSRELLGIIKARSYDTWCDSVGDDVYRWQVELMGFSPSSPLGKDMQEVQKRYGYSSVSVTLTFMRGLHPFFPASLEIVRPHFKHWGLGAAASHPMLQLQNWDPFRPQAELIQQIKTFLEANTHVDLASPLNDITRFPNSCYLPSQRHLARLEALTGTPPLCIKDGPQKSEEAAQLYAARGNYTLDTARLEALKSEGGAGGNKKRVRTDAAAPAAAAAGAAAAAATGVKKSTYWAPGTGYGYGEKSGGQVWDARASEAAQRARDEELRRLMEVLARSLARELRPPEQGGSAEPPPAPSTGAAPMVTEGAGASTGAQPQQGSEAAAGGQGAGTSEAPAAAAPAEVPAATSGRQTRAKAKAAAAEAAAAKAEPAGAGTGSSSKAAGPQPAAAGAAPSTSKQAVSAPSAGTSAAAAGGQGSRPGQVAVAHGIEGLGQEPEEASQELLQAEEEEAGRYPCDPAACLASVSASCLLPVIIKEMRITSFSDMLARVPYYKSILHVLSVLCRPECAPLLAQPMPADVEGGTSVAAVVAQLSIPATQYIKLTKPALASKAEEEAKLAQIAQSTSSTSALAQQRAASEALSDLRSTMRFAVLAAEVAARMAAVTAAHTGGAGAGPGGQQGLQAGGGAGPSGSGGPVDEEQVYCQTMRPLQVEEVEKLIDANFAYRNEYQREGVQPAERITRLGREIAGLMGDLPLSASSSVFVRIDEDKMMVWRALMTGPDDTPYSNGCFIFDFYFPPTYPQICPLVKLKTTGGGTVRFNPNLYNCGKVCLSLLGTWQGDKGEGWLPGISTANQVFLSIQSLILVEHPYFNEPGYERTMNTPQGDNESRRYNSTIREATIRYAMVDLLKHPPPEFKSVITAHFKLRRTKILACVDKWITEAEAWNAGHKTKLQALRTELLTCLDKL